MSQVKRFITYELPNETKYDYIKLYESTTETGYFSLTSSSSYTYGTKATEFTLDTNKWYKLKFYDSVNDTYSPFTQAVDGSAYDDRELLAAVGNSFDGAGYATVSDFHILTKTNSDQFPTINVARSLRIGRAYIDLITGDQSPYKYSKDWGLDTTKRKYNAELQLIKTAEIYFGAALLYQDLSDDKVMLGLSGNLQSTSLVSGSITVPSDLTPSGLVISDIAESSIGPSGQLTTSSILPSGQLTEDNVTAGSFSVGSTSISNSLTEIDTGRFNLDKEISIARFNLDKELAIAKLNIDKELAVAKFNADTALAYANFNSQQKLAFTELLDNKTKYNNELSRYDYERQTSRYLAEAEFLSQTAIRYAAKADAIMETFKPSAIPISYGQYRRNGNKFFAPGDIFSFSLSNTNTVGITLDFSIADLTGLGVFNDNYLQLNTATMAANAVDGILGLNVFPSQISNQLIQAQLNVNGVVYYLDYWEPYVGAIQVGKAGTTSGKIGFSLKFDPFYADSVGIQWNYSAANGGFDLTVSDVITLSFIA